MAGLFGRFRSRFSRPARAECRVRKRLLHQRVPKREAPPRRYDMKKSINLWAFPYPDQMSLQDCFQLAKDAGFDGVEINFALEGEFSAESTPDEIRSIGRLAEKVGIAISGVCSFLYWPYSLTHADPQRRQRGLQLARQMIQAAKLVGTENLLVVPAPCTCHGWMTSNRFRTTFASAGRGKPSSNCCRTPSGPGCT
jgi:hypothetical protein